MNDIESRHACAVAEGRDTYVDPESGFEVFTAAYLRGRGICCGSACRHCPYDHENVEPAEHPVRRKRRDRSRRPR